MTGPEHYAEAERLLNEAADLPRAVVEVTGRSLSQEDASRLKDHVQGLMAGPVVVAGPGVSVDITPMLRAAQVHATLALTAATVIAGGLTKTGDLGVPLYPRWVKAVSD